MAIQPFAPCNILPVKLTFILPVSNSVGLIAVTLIDRINGNTEYVVVGEELPVILAFIEIPSDATKYPLADTPAIVTVDKPRTSIFRNN